MMTCVLAATSEVFLHDHDLRTEVDDRAEIERIAGEHDQIELVRHRHQPVELRQRVVEIGDDQAAHGMKISEWTKRMEEERTNVKRWNCRYCA
jgi:hypothetical protein